MNTQTMQKFSRYSNKIAILLILTASILAYASAWNDSLIVDEIPHVGAGYSYLKALDMRINPEHPPLPKILGAFPLLFVNLSQKAFESYDWTTAVNGQWDFGRQLIYGDGNNADLITHLVKIPMVLLYALASYLIFYWTRKLYGEIGGFLALILFAFSPTVMTHSRFVTTDIAAAIGVLFAAFFYTSYLKKPSKTSFLLGAIAFGVALLMKFSTFLLIPCFLFIALMWNFRTIWKTVLLMIAGFVLVVWPLYFILSKNYPQERQYSDTKFLMQTFGKRYLAEPIIWASDKPILRAAAHYGLGFLMVTQRSAGGNTVYFKGNVTDRAGITYFPTVYFLKEPIAWWLLFLLAIIIFLFNIRHTSFMLKPNVEVYTMIIWMLIYWGVSLQSSLNIGVRHLMPIYPFMIILVGGKVGDFLEKSQNKTRYYAILGFVFFTIAWFFAENLKVFPNYLTYFNQFAGGPSGGYRYVVDSNLDWGQDIKRLDMWLEENNVKKIELDYFGWADQKYYLGDRFDWLTVKKYSDARDFINNSKTNGWIAVSATFLQNESKKGYAWLTKYKPRAVVGNSIFVYRITAL